MLYGGINSQANHSLGVISEKLCGGARCAQLYSPQIHSICIRKEQRTNVNIRHSVSQQRDWSADLTVIVHHLSLSLSLSLSPEREP